MWEQRSSQNVSTGDSVGGSQGKRFCLEIAHALSRQRLCTHVNCVDAVWHASLMARCMDNTYVSQINIAPGLDDVLKHFICGLQQRLY